MWCDKEPKNPNQKSAETHMEHTSLENNLVPFIDQAMKATK